MDSLWNHIRIFIAASKMFSNCVFGETNMLTVWTLVAGQQSQVLGFDMSLSVEFSVRAVLTFGALPQIFPIISHHTHHFRFNLQIMSYQKNKIVTFRKKSHFMISALMGV